MQLGYFFIAVLCLSDLHSSASVRENAVLLVLCRESDLLGILSSIEQLESRFNRRFGYPYVFLNNGPFSNEFKKSIRNIINNNSQIEFGMIDTNSTEWSYPSHINQTLAAEKRLEMKQNHVQYGGNEQYHFMCHYFSGFFFDHPLVLRFDYYWRIEPNVDFMCDILSDPFRELHRVKAIYGYVLLHAEIMSTIPTLWQHTKSFLELKYKTLQRRRRISNPSFSPKCSLWIKNNTTDVITGPTLKSLPSRSSGPQITVSTSSTWMPPGASSTSGGSMHQYTPWL